MPLMQWDRNLGTPTTWLLSLFGQDLVFGWKFPYTSHCPILSGLYTGSCPDHIWICVQATSTFSSSCQGFSATRKTVILLLLKTKQDIIYRHAQLTTQHWKAEFNPRIQAHLQYWRSSRRSALCWIPRCYSISARSVVSQPAQSCPSPRSRVPARAVVSQPAQSCPSPRPSNIYPPLPAEWTSS